MAHDGAVRPGAEVKYRVGFRRIAAFALDWCVVAIWGGLLFGLVMWWSDGLPSAPPGPWVGQGIGMLSMTVPVVVYFSLLESSAIRGSLGKRALGLIVTDERGERVSWASALFRNVIKFAPWEFGHVLAQQAIHSTHQGLPVWTVVPALIAFAGPLIWLVELFRTGLTPYDRISATFVRLRPSDHR